MRLTSPLGKIVGVGIYVPERVVTNEEIAERVPTSSDWIVRNLGIRERHVAAQGELTSDMAAAAATAALSDANVSAESIDLLIVATSTPDRIAPSTACLVHGKIGMRHGAAFDLAAVCSGFVYALTVAQQFVATGAARRVLVVGADRFSTITDWERRDCVFFGDGAGAVVLERSHQSGLFVSQVFADARGLNGNGHDGFTVHVGASHFTMDGRAVFQTATKVLPDAIRRVLTEADLSLAQVRYLIPHQPSVSVLLETAQLLGLPWEKVVKVMDRYANTSAATIPIALHEVYSRAEFQPGDHLLFAAVGSGWTWGAAAYRWL